MIKAVSLGDCVELNANVKIWTMVFNLQIEKEQIKLKVIQEEK